MKLPLRKRLKSHNIFTGIGRKFLLYFILFSIIPIVFISAFGYKLTEKIILNQNIRSLQLQNEIIAAQIEELFAKANQQLILKNTSKISYLIKILMDDSQSHKYHEEIQQQLIQLLNEEKKSKNLFTGLSLVKNSGEIIVDPDSFLVNINEKTLSKLIKAGWETITTRSSMDHLQWQILISCSLNVKSTNSPIYLVAAFNHQNLQELIKQFSEHNPSVEIYIVDENNSVIFFSPQNSSLKIIRANIVHDAPTIFFKRWDGQKVLRRNYPINHTGLTLFADAPYHKIMAEVIMFRNQVILGVGILLVLLIGLAFYISQRITIPIRQLVYSAQDIGDGLLDAPIRINSSDEIGVLAKELDNMRKNLLDYYENLEKKVQQRTEELKRAQFQIMHQEKMASLGLMAAGIAHEIGNPLTSISSLTQLLKRRLKDEKNLEYLSTIMKNIDRISRIVRELVDFSRPSNFEAKLTDINEVARAAVGIVKYDSRSKNIQFQMDLQPDLPRTVLVPDQLLQVFINILFNAVDAMEGYGDTLTLRTFSEENYIHIHIKDTGCGIDENDINKIFEPFYTTKEVGKGTGLGLSVSYGIIRNFEGEISVESQVGKGSTFKIKLPIKNSTRE